MLIVAVQAIVAVAYIHHSEQTGTEYVSFDHDTYVNALQSDSEESGKASLDDYGCHHCCHCTGIFSFLTNGSIHAVISEKKRFGYILELPSASISPHLRPPIL